LFCVLAYALSWTWWGLRFAPHLFPLLGASKTLDRAGIGALDVQVGIAGPLLAALLMRCFISREGLRGSLGWRRSWRLYLLALLVPAGIGVGALVLDGVVGNTPFDWAGDTPLSLLPRLSLIVLLVSATAVGEEYGWRGYLLPRLLPLGEVRATLLTGLLWGSWHLPLLVVGLSYAGAPVALAIPIFIFSAIAVSFVFTLFYLLSTGSVVIAAVIHGTLNTLSEVTTPQHLPHANALVVSPFGVTTSLVDVVLIAVVYGFVRRRSRITGPKMVAG